MFDADITTAMKDIFTATTTNASKWIIFRSKKMKIVDADYKNFTYYAISQNGVKFLEK